MKTCETCGYEQNPNGAKQCKGCGAPFFVDKLRKAEEWAKDKI